MVKSATGKIIGKFINILGMVGDIKNAIGTFIHETSTGEKVARVIKAITGIVSSLLPGWAGWVGAGVDYITGLIVDYLYPDTRGVFY